MHTCHNPIHCIIPPHVLDHMAECEDARVRRTARENIAMAAELRAIRTVALGISGLSANLNVGKKHRMVHTLKNRQPLPFLLPGALVRSEGDAPVKDPAVNEAYNYSGATYDFYKKNYNRNSLDNHGMSLISTVHAGRNFNNAFWNGRQMVYGDGDGVVFKRFTRSLDVVGHELSHGVVTFTADLEYQDEPGALNEHFADVFGSLIKQWKKKQTAKKADWLIGADIIVPAPTRKALRSMAAPGTAYANDPILGSDIQPAHMRDKFTGSADNGGVHINSGIPNHAFFLAAREVGGQAWQKVGRVWYRSLLKLNRQSDFAEARDTTVEVAEREFGVSGPVKRAVAAGWKAVGL